MSSSPVPSALPFGETISPAEARDFATQFGLLPREQIEVMQQRKLVWGQIEIEPSQLQPASLDLRLGTRAFRVRASFLPGKERQVADQLAALRSDEISLEGEGGVLERGCVYVIPLLEHFNLTESFSASANPKSSTGRLDIFTRLITDRSEVFDTVERGYQGPLYAEVSPRSFSVRVRKGSRLNQIRFRRWHPQQFFSRTEFGVDDKELREWHSKTALVDGELNLRTGLVVRIALSADSLGSSIIGYRAQKHTDIIDVDRVGAYEVERILGAAARARRTRGSFSIRASSIFSPLKKSCIFRRISPPKWCRSIRRWANFASITPASSIRASALRADGRPGSRAVLEVRSHEVPFILEDGQVIGRLVYEKMAAPPQLLYGQAGLSNYQGQGLKLSKHFRM